MAVLKEALLFAAAQTGSGMFEKLHGTYRRKPTGLHPSPTTLMGNIMSKITDSDHATTDRLSEGAHESVDQIAKTAGKAEERIRHEAADAEARARDLGHKAKVHSDETLQRVSVFVRDNPVISLGLAFAAGALVSALRRRS